MISCEGPQVPAMWLYRQRNKIDRYKDGGRLSLHAKGNLWPWGRLQRHIQAIVQCSKVETLTSFLPFPEHQGWGCISSVGSSPCTYGSNFAKFINFHLALPDAFTWLRDLCRLLEGCIPSGQLMGACRGPSDGQIAPKEEKAAFIMEWNL